MPGRAAPHPAPLRCIAATYSASSPRRSRLASARTTKPRRSKEKRKTKQPELHTSKEARRSLSAVPGYFIDDLRRSALCAEGRRLNVARSTAATKPPSPLSRVYSNRNIEDDASIGCRPAHVEKFL
ncbi:PREDICTED: uncharacterized protein LOC106746065 isoform X2 [Dinoponera quadriceps]|uniref:Uncharacterized protein LOC106746065 isoform X2 n=1 Tax=Dinoponera quadriceps TaxID=609295 RepID=A0A6P3XIC7_DINQU|nr:PREDICTED: uncharacterized protein LOC106746065 isoform X2 [Dinoponera quadriceps]